MAVLPHQSDGDLAKPGAHSTPPTHTHTHTPGGGVKRAAPRASAFNSAARCATCRCSFAVRRAREGSALALTSSTVYSYMPPAVCVHACVCMRVCIAR